MTDWERAEDMVAKATGGKKTPGSGNKNVKGDVQLRSEGWMFEVKQTSKDKLSVKRSWFAKLEKFRSTFDLCLVIFFELRGTPYFFRYVEGNDATWKSCTVTEDTLPDTFHTRLGVWEKDTWDSLYELRDE